MSNNRLITFGKYKGTPILKVICEHIGYIMWCLSNLKWFKLTDEEQAVYDAVAISIIKYNIKMVFPINEMLLYVKDKIALEKKETPLIANEVGYLYGDMDSAVVKSLIPIFGDTKYRVSKHNLCAGDLYSLAQSYDKMVRDYDELADYEDDTICYHDIFG